MTDWTQHQDDISDAISDSMDMDWSANDGARAVVAWLNEHKPLSAAPAPEGGAVDARAVAKTLNPALFSHDKVEAHRAASPHTVTSARIDAVDEVRKVLDAAALATREEAPAEAGEVRRAIKCLTFELDRVHPNHKTMFVHVADLRVALAALGAQPQTRAWGWDYEICTGCSASLTMADIKAGGQASCCPERRMVTVRDLVDAYDAQRKPPAREDALREAAAKIEECQTLIDMNAERAEAIIRGKYGRRMIAGVRLRMSMTIDRLLDEALAALQAEQKGGA